MIQKLSKANIVPLGISGTEKLLPINDKDMALERFQFANVAVNIGKALELPKKIKKNQNMNTKIDLWIILWGK